MGWLYGFKFRRLIVLDPFALHVPIESLGMQLSIYSFSKTVQTDWISFFTNIFVSLLLSGST